MKYTKAEMLEMAEKHSPEMFKLVALDCLEWLTKEHIVNFSIDGVLRVDGHYYDGSDLSEAIRAAIKEVAK